MARALVKEIKDTRKNYIINGDMRLAQRNTSFTSIATGVYNLDRWRYSKSGAMVHNLTQDTDVPTSAQAGYLFTNSLRMNLTTPDTSIAASDNISIDQSVEGFNWANLAQKPFTLSFWVKATLPGTYCVGFRNSGNDRSYVAEYNINSASTWEYKVITVLASPSAGTWNYTNGIGLDIRWMLAAGTNFHTTANAWQTGNFLATANQINGVNTGATDFRITGVMLNEGSYAAPFSLFGKDRTGELLACKRYFQKTYEVDTAVGTNTANGAFSGAADANGVSHHFGTKWFQPEMRTTPNVGQYRISGGAPSGTPFTDSDGVSNPFGASFYNVSHKGFSMHITGGSGAGATKYAHFTFEAEL